MNRLKLNPNATLSFADGSVRITVPGGQPLRFGPELLPLLWHFQIPSLFDDVLQECQPDAREILRGFIPTLESARILVPEGFKPSPYLPPDIDDAPFRQIYERCMEHVMGGAAAMYGLYKAVEYVVKASIPGDFAECGVWRGGSSMAMALTLLHFGETTRTLYLYDTFEGLWSVPVEQDRVISSLAKPDLTRFYKERLEAAASKRKDAGDQYRHKTSLEDVRALMCSTGYPETRLKLVKGFVEETIPQICPDRLALMRLDTDFYTSTYHELKHLYPKLERGGILFVDDYGQYLGARVATDEYLCESGFPVLLNRLSDNERIAVKIR